MGLVLENGIWKLQADAAGGGWEKVWYASADSDWSGASADWTGFDSKAINGVTFTIERKEKWDTFGPDGSGNVRFKLVSTANYGSGTTDAPVIYASVDDLLGSDSPDKDDFYIWRILLAASSPDPANGNEGVGGGFRQSTSTTIAAPNDSGAIWMLISTRKIRTSINGGDYTATAPSGVRVLSSEVNTTHGVINRFSTSAATTDPQEGTRCHTLQLQTSVVDTTPAPPDFDITATAASCYVSGWGAASGGTFLISDLELWRLQGTV